MSPLIVIDGVTLNVEAETLHVAGNAVHLTAYEFRVLKHLMLAQGRLVPAAEIETALYGENRTPSNVLQVIVSRLRSKLDKAEVVGLIHTLRGRGYRIDAPAAGAAQ